MLCRGVRGVCPLSAGQAAQSSVQHSVYLDHALPWRQPLLFRPGRTIICTARRDLCFYFLCHGVYPASHAKLKVFLAFVVARIFESSVTSIWTLHDSVTESTSLSMIRCCFGPAVCEVMTMLSGRYGHIKILVLLVWLCA